jgi:hypothetical protein
MSNGRLSIPASSKDSIRRVVCTWANANRDPHQKAMSDVGGVKADEVRERIIRAISLARSPRIVIVAGHVLSVYVVRGGGLNSSAKGFAKEQLSDVVDVSTHDSIVGEKGVVVVGNDVLVDGSSFAVSGEDGNQGGNSIRISGLKTTEVGRIEGCFVTANINTRVDSSSIGSLADIDHHVFNSFASGLVDKLELKIDWYSSLIFGDVGTNEFTVDVVTR